MNNKLRHLPTNTAGRDFIVGDLHGCFDDLNALLNGVGFNPSVDRLISVGDLVDRGPQNMECIDLLYEQWMFAVRGNHEQMMADTVLRGEQNAKDMWLYNGGSWSLFQDKNELKIAATLIDELPLVITVGEGADRYNVVHAELVHSKQQSSIIHSGVSSTLVTDDMIDTWSFSSFDEMDMVWGRSLISNSKYQPAVTTQDADKLSITFVGHTPRNVVTRVEQQIYLDTGAVYFHTGTAPSEQRSLTMACPTDGNIYTYNLVWKTVTSFPINSVKKAQ